MCKEPSPPLTDPSDDPIPFLPLPPHLERIIVEAVRLFLYYLHHHLSQEANLGKSDLQPPNLKP